MFGSILVGWFGKSIWIDLCGLEVASDVVRDVACSLSDVDIR